MSLWKQIVARWGSGAGENDDVRMDAATNSLMVVDYAHHEIHAGSSFTCHYEQMVSDIGDQTVIAFNTPDTTKWGHLTISASYTSIARVSLVENPSIDVDEGTDLVVYNRDRNSLTASIMLSVENPAVAGGVTSYTAAQAAGANITETTQLNSDVKGLAGVGGSSRGAGESTSGRLEFILEQGQQYAVIIESLDASDNYHTIGLNWYEHTSAH